MAVGENIGGFWAYLDLKTKEKSFKKGLSKLKNVKNSVLSFSKSIIKSFSLTGGGLLALTVATAQYEARNMMVASSLKMSATELVAWRSAANMAGTSADGLTGALLELEKKSNRIKLGEVDIGLAKSLGMLGLGYQNFLKQDPSQKMKMVFEKAMNMADKGKAGELVRDVLGDSGKEMFQYMEMTGQSLDKILAKSKALMFTNDSTRKKAMMFNQEFKATFGSFKEMGSLFFSTFGSAMIPVLRNLQMLIIKNKGLIKTGIVRFAKEVAKITKKVFGLFMKGVPMVVRITEKLGGLDKTLRLLFAGFLALKTVQTVSGLTSILSALTGFSKLKLTGGLFAFAALFLLIQDIATYMKWGNKADTFTGRFIEWLDKIGERTAWVKELSNALQILMGHIEDADISKLGTTGLIGLAVTQRKKVLEKQGFSTNEIIKEAKNTSDNIKKLILLQKKDWTKWESFEALTLGLKQSQIGDPERIRKIELTLIVEGNENIVKEIKGRAVDGGGLILKKEVK